MTRGGNLPWRERRPVRRTCEPGPRSSRQTPATKVVADPHILAFDIDTCPSSVDTLPSNIDILPSNIDTFHQMLTFFHPD